MTLQVTNGAKSLALAYLVANDTTVENLKLRLYNNDYTPDQESISSDFIQVTSGNGYEEKSLVGSSWLVNGTTASYPVQTWDFTGSVGNIYGYYVITATNNTVLFAERFPSAPYNVANNGDKISVTLNLTSN
jgi:hypothetical protein